MASGRHAAFAQQRLLSASQGSGSALLPRGAPTARPCRAAGPAAARRLVTSAALHLPTPLAPWNVTDAITRGAGLLAAATIAPVAAPPRPGAAPPRLAMLGGAPAGASAAGGPAAARPSAAEITPDHLVVCAVRLRGRNGLWGCDANWEYFREHFAAAAGGARVHVHASAANPSWLTHDGVDVCGARLAEEVRAVVASRPGLKRISFVGHSLGGLLCRYAAGALYDRRTGTVAGLQPAQLLTLATPHLGCDGTGAAGHFVPFLDWAGGALAPALRAVARVVSPLLIGRTGGHLFLRDADGPGGLPLLQRLCRDEAGDLPFLSALSAFERLSTYANCDEDFIVGWTTASIRRPEDRPATHVTEAFEAPAGAGVGAAAAGASAAAPLRQAPRIVQDERPAGRPPALAATLVRAAGAVAVGLAAGLAGAGAAAAAAGLAAPGAGYFAAAAAARGAALPAAAAAATAAAALSPGAAARAAAAPAAAVEDIRARLSALPWRRVDVSFDGLQSDSLGPIPLPQMAHNHIQVTRKWMNGAGISVVDHAISNFLAEEQRRRTAVGQIESLVGLRVPDLPSLPALPALPSLASLPSLSSLSSLPALPALSALPSGLWGGVGLGSIGGLGTLGTTGLGTDLGTAAAGWPAALFEALAAAGAAPPPLP